MASFAPNLSETWTSTENSSDLEPIMSADEYLERVVGPKYLPLSAVLPITIVYVIIFVTGVVGNVCVCLVVVKNPTLQTATNFYLFSLSVSDLTVLVLGLPNDLKLYWQQYPWGLGVGLCKIRALVSEMTSYVSVLVIVAFSLERYLAICHPLLSYTMAGLRRAARIIAASWLLALVAAIPFAVYTNVHYVEYPENSGQYLETICYMPNATWPLVFSSFAFFIIPMTILVFIYASIGIQIRLASTVRGAMDGSSDGESRQKGSRKAILRMLVAVVIGFFVCFAPHHAQRLLFIYGKNLPNFRAINEYMYYVTGCFYYLSATINPILYNVLSAKYRQAFKENLCGRRSPYTLANSSVARGSTHIQLKNCPAQPSTTLSALTVRRQVSRQPQPHIDSQQRQQQQQQQQQEQEQQEQQQQQQQQQLQVQQQQQQQQKKEQQQQQQQQQHLQVQLVPSAAGCSAGANHAVRTVCTGSSTATNPNRQDTHRQSHSVTFKISSTCETQL